jgi:hypothetical protein
MRVAYHGTRKGAQCDGGTNLVRVPETGLTVRLKPTLSVCKTEPAYESGLLIFFQLAQRNSDLCAGNAKHAVRKLNFFFWSGNVAFKRFRIDYPNAGSAEGERVGHNVARRPSSRPRRRRR